MYSDDHEGVFSGWGGLIAILVVLFLFGYNQNGNRCNNGVAEAVALSSFANANRNSEISTLDIIRGQQSIEKSVCDAGYANQALTNGTQRDILNGNNLLGQQLAGVAQIIQNNSAGLQAALRECCCETQKEILRLEAQADKNTCAIINAIHADGEATRKQAQDFRYSNLERDFNAAQTAISNDRQSQYILNQLGRFVTNPCCPPPCYCCNPCPPTPPNAQTPFKA